MTYQQKVEGLMSFLKEQSDFITAKSLSKQLNVSEKTIYRLVKDINQPYFPDELISTKKGCGFKLKSDLLHENQPESDKIIFSPTKRQEQLLEKLLMASPKKLFIYDLSQDFYVSDSVIMKDKSQLQKKLNRFKLKITTQSGQLFIQGSEDNIRQAIATLIPTFNTIDINHLSLSTYSDTFDMMLTRFLLNEMRKIEIHLDAELPYPYNVNIFSHLYIMVKRMKKNPRKTLASTGSSEPIALDKMLFNESKRVIHDIGEYLGFKIDKVEVYYLYQYLHSSRFQRHTPLQKTYFSKRVVAVTKYYLSEMAMTKRHAINEHAPMFIDLANHISPLLRRLDNKIYIKNKMLDDIQKNYSSIYQQTADVSEKMVKHFNFPPITADEIGFLTLYFVRFYDIQTKPIRTLVMCSSGIGISELLKHKLEKNFPDIHVVDVISYKETLANNPDYSTIDLIVTSVAFESDLKKKIPTVLVSALMTEDDQNRLRKKIKEIYYGK